MSINLQVAILRAKRLAKSNFRRAVEVLVAAKVRLESAIAAVARFHAAFA